MMSSGNTNSEIEKIAIIISVFADCAIRAMAMSKNYVTIQFKAYYCR